MVTVMASSIQLDLFCSRRPSRSARVSRRIVRPRTTSGWVQDCGCSSAPGVGAGLHPAVLIQDHGTSVRIDRLGENDHAHGSSRWLGTFRTAECPRQESNLDLPLRRTRCVLLEWPRIQCLCGLPGPADVSDLAKSGHFGRGLGSKKGVLPKRSATARVERREQPEPVAS